MNLKHQNLHHVIFPEILAQKKQPIGLYGRWSVPFLQKLHHLVNWDWLIISIPICRDIALAPFT
jgi:hypothetical protein